MNGRALLIGVGAAVALGSCDLDLAGAFGEYCVEHLGSCDGGAVDAGADGGSAGISLDVWCERHAQAIADHSVRCGSAGSIDVYDNDISFCQRSFRPQARHGALRFQPAAAEECLARIAAAPCSNQAALTCSDVLVPNAHLGEPCDTGACVEGYCSDGAWFASTCPVCKPFAQLGERCLGFGQGGCVTGLYCGMVVDGGNECGVPKPDGTSCTFEQECASHLCRNFGNLDGGGSRCGAAVLGEPCFDQNFCGPFAYCRGAEFSPADGGAPQPGACTVRIPLGQACVNASIIFPGGDQGCADGGTCHAGVCAAPSGQPVGAVCDNSSQCLRGHCDVPFPGTPGFDGGASDGVCVSDRGVGQACQFSGDCSIGLFCMGDGGCGQPLPLGAACSSSAAECGSRYCTFQPDGGGFRCAEPAGPGEACAGRGCHSFFECRANDAGTPVCQQYQVDEMAPGPPFCASLHFFQNRCQPSCFP